MLKKALFTLSLITLPAMSFAAGGVEVEEHDWDFYGIRANWDKAAIYRGYKVATGVCYACHGFKYISHRDLMKVGFTEEEVKALAAEMDMGIDDKLLSPLSDENAQEIYGKPLPDLSMMNKARGSGADYTYAVLTGYEDYPPDHFTLPEGAYYNRAFPGHAIAMPPPFMSDDLVEYHDETPATVDQMAKDVTYFMQWTAEPERFMRHHTGVGVLIYLVIFTILTIMLKRIVWADVKKK